MPTFRIVEAFDAVAHFSFGFFSVSIGLRALRSVLSEEEEAVHRRIAPKVSGNRSSSNDAVIGHQPLELLPGVSAAASEVMQQRIGFRCA